MELFPAIDLQKGQCVRLAQGDFNAATVYESDPLRQARSFAQAGAKWLHVVDLDGAQQGASRQSSIIEKIAKSTTLRVQVGGGIRDTETIDTFLNCGVERVVIGSLSVTDPEAVCNMFRRFGGKRIVLALDVRLNDKSEPEVLTKGWQAGSQKMLWDVINNYEPYGLTTVLCTDVSRDGMMVGPNFDLYREFQKRCPSLDLLASGGVRDQQDVILLKDLHLTGAIIGKALYEGRIDLKAALQAMGDRCAG